MKKCPFCAEEIQDDAIKCRFCGELLDGRSHKRGGLRSCINGCLIGIGIFILFSFLFIFLGILLFKFTIAKIFSGSTDVFSHIYPPFTGPGLELMMRDLSAMLGVFFEKFRDVFYSGRHVL